MAGIQEYWIIDGRDRTLRILRPQGSAGYADHAVVPPGRQWRSEHPFPLVVDPADLC